MPALRGATRIPVDAETPEQRADNKQLARQRYYDRMHELARDDAGLAGPRLFFNGEFRQGRAFRGEVEGGAGARAWAEEWREELEGKGWQCMRRPEGGGMLTEAGRLNGAVISTQSGPRTLVVENVRAVRPGINNLSEIDLGFAEEPGLTCKLRVYEESLIEEDTRQRVLRLLEIWLRGEPANGSLLTIPANEVPPSRCG